ncbi:MAG: glycosyltransferase family 4 protein [Bacteroidales bacterium]|nr:glycosyltransferase family 4 protein [Bacteroidales bacterium]
MDSQRKKIGFLLHGIFYGGASRSFIQLIDKLYKTELFDIYVYTVSISSNQVKNEILKRVKCIKKVRLNIVTANQAYTSNENDLNKINKKDINYFIELIKKDQIDILHVNTTVFSHILNEVKLNTNIKIIVHIRELIPSDNVIGIKIIENIKNNANFIICISENEEKNFIDFQKREVIPNTVDFDEIDSVKKNTFRNLHKINENIVIITMSSHLYKPKGHLLLLDAIKIFTDEYSNDNFLFVIVGAKLRFYYFKKYLKRLLKVEDYLTEIFDKIQELKLKKYVKVIPYTYNIYSIIRDSDIIVRPSLSLDPWGRDIIEGMAFGKPIIATGSSSYYIIPGVTGFLVEPDPKALAEKIKLLVKNKQFSEALGNKGRERIEKICNSDINIKKIINIYNELVL